MEASADQQEAVLYALVQMAERHRREVIDIFASPISWRASPRRSRS